MKWVVGALVAVGLVMAGVYGLLSAESGTSTDEAGNTVIHFGAPDIRNAEMWAIQDDVAVMSFVDENDRALGWQRPVSSYVGVRFGAESGSRGIPNIRMIAYDPDGNVVEEASWALPAQG